MALLKQLLFIVLVVFISTSEACVGKSWVRATGDWTVDADNGQTPGKQTWDPAEPLGVMNLDSSSCLYVVYWEVSHLVPGKTYNWKVTIEGSWTESYGCPGRGGPDCKFTASSTGKIVFVFNPQDNTLSTRGAATPTSPTPSPTTPAPTSPTPSPTSKPAPVGSGKQVFAHFMIGNTYGYTQQLFERDMRTAQSVGIDAFALNIGKDGWTWDRVRTAYTAAANVGFKCFLSFDMSFYNNADDIINGVRNVAGLSSQYKYNNKVFVSTFAGTSQTMGYSSVNAAWAAIKSALGNIFLVPNFAVNAYTVFDTFPSIDGEFSWGAWPNPTDFASGLTPEDNIFMDSARRANKVYMAPWSPWFYTHLPYKNYLYHCDSLWYDRWVQLLSINPHMIEIISWNDWGEAHYIGEIDTNPGDLPEGAKDFVYGFPHTAWLDTLPYFISYYKNGVAPAVTKDTVVYWYRPFLKNSGASADPYGQPQVANKDTSLSSYTPSQVLADSIFVVTILRSPGTVRVTSGGTTVTKNVPAGVNFFSTPLSSGGQSVTLLRNDATLCTNTGAVSVGTSSTKYNYNAYVSGCKFT
jgi:glucan endo-1,3-alpha-glucosidase